MYIRNYVVTINTTGAATPITSTTRYVRMLSIQAANSNAAAVWVGGISATTANGQQLNAREAHIVNDTQERIDESKFYVIGTANDTVRVETIAGGT